ncbi:hypothetical protein MKX01_017369 [Papaver californicum]|nr:hypothetical protein MKX01_017369 [Papaver californicum]
MCRCVQTSWGEASFLIFLPLIFLLHPIFIQECTCGNDAFSGNDIVKETCEQCAQKSPLLNYDFCVTSLEAVPDSKTAAELAQINATDTILVIREQLKYKDLDAYTFPSLNACLDLNTDAISRLAKSIEAIWSYNYVNLNIWVGTAMEACEDGFREKGRVSPLRKHNSNFFQLCNIALVISNLASPLLFKTQKPEIAVYDG